MAIQNDISPASNASSGLSEAEVLQLIADNAPEYTAGDGLSLTSNTFSITPIAILTKTASHILVLTDASKLIQMNLAGANTVTIPANASVAFPIGTQILIAQKGAGQTTITPDTGVTIDSAGGKTKLNAQESMCSIIKVAINEWRLAGDLTT